MADFTFNIDDFPDLGTAMICENESEVEVFLDYLDSVGRRWRSGSSYLDLSNYNSGRIAYYFNKGLYDDDWYVIQEDVKEGHALYFRDFLCSDENYSFPVSISDIFK